MATSKNKAAAKRPLPAKAVSELKPTTEVVRKMVAPPADSKARPLKRPAPVTQAINQQVPSQDSSNLSPDKNNKSTANSIATEKANTPAVDSKLESNLAKQPPRALNSPVRIFQIYFEGWERELLDPAFYPLDNSRGTSELMEFAVFEQLQKNQATQGATLWGALSWRFGEKTGMQGNDWVK